MGSTSTKKYLKTNTVITTGLVGGAYANNMETETLTGYNIAPYLQG